MQTNLHAPWQEHSWSHYLHFQQACEDTNLQQVIARLENSTSIWVILAIWRNIQQRQMSFLKALHLE